MKQDLKEWALENEEALLLLYFNCDSDLYNDYPPYDDSVCHTEEQMLEWEENYDPDRLPNGFIEAVYTTIEKRDSKTLKLI